MHIERGQRFDAGGAVMKLVKHTPEEVESVHCPVPPVCDEAAGKEAQSPNRNFWPRGWQCDQRISGKPPMEDNAGG